jgi:hypothetical protein
LSILTKKYGSLQKVSGELKKQLKSYYQKFGFNKRINTQFRQLFYTRYAADFVIGIVGPKSFANEIKSQLISFIKSDLHLDLNKTYLLNRNSHGVKFLNYLICLSKASKIISLSPQKIQSFNKYKQRVLAKNRKTEEFLDKVAFFKAKSSLLRAYKSILNFKGLNWSKFNVYSVSLDLVFLLNQSLDIFHNSAFEKWINVYDKKSENTLFFAVKFYNENIKNLFDSVDITSEKLLKMHLLKNQFITDLDVIMFNKVDKVYNLNSKSKINNWVLKSKPFQIKALELSRILTEIFLSFINTRSVQILAPLKNILNNLRVQGFLHHIKKRPCSNRLFLLYSDFEIIKVYSELIYGLLYYYRAVDNFRNVKSLIFHLRKSCILTLSRKHKKSLSWVYERYGEDISIKTSRFIVIKLPTKRFLSSLNKKYLVDDYNMYYNLTDILDKYLYSKRQFFCEKSPLDFEYGKYRILDDKHISNNYNIKISYSKI